MRIPPKETQFKKGKSGNPNGRPKDHPLKHKIGVALIDAMVKLLRMKKQDAIKKIQGNPTMLEITAWKYINETPTLAIDRFSGPIRKEITGEGGGPIEGSMTITFDPGTD